MARNPEFGRNGAAPKYKQIYTQLRQSLTDHVYSRGGKLPSESELVEQFGASRPTVGRALAQLESEGLVERRAGSGTFIRLRNHQEGFVFGLLIPELGITEIFEPICRGISTARVGGHHDLLWGTTFSPGASEEDQAEQLCEYYLERRVSGIFFAPMELCGRKDEINQRITRLLDDAQIPIVLLDRDICDYPRRSRYDLVGIDNRRAGFVITEHLLECGARRILFFGRPNSAPTVSARSAGYLEALRTFPGSRLEERVEYGDPSDVSAVRDLVAQYQPDAVVCANDYTAGQFMTTLNTLNIRVPHDIRVTGMDDIRYATVMQTPLTTIHQPCLDLGAAALAAMLDRASNPKMPARDLLVDFRLVVRQSTVPVSNLFSTKQG
jgi:GntR family transcriptional regulator, arabinose operon transcriptional repressor